MMRAMRRFGGALAVFGLIALAAGRSEASIIPPSEIIPDSEVLINFNGTGLDWVYAGPVAPGEFGAGEIEAPSYRAGEGWRYATAEEWLLKPEWDDFIRPGFEGGDPASYSFDHEAYRFTSEYWSSFTHVDPGDAAAGFITNGLDIGSLNSVWETWYVRTSGFAPVPEPASMAMLAAGGLGLIGYARRRKAGASA